MLIIITIIFLIALISLFGMMMFRAWELSKQSTEETQPARKIIPEIYFRHIEKIMLYLAKHIIQSIVFVVMKYWFIVLTKIKSWAVKNWPKVYKFFRHQKEESDKPKNSFVQKAILESKIRIRSIKEKVRREHEEKINEETQI